MYLNVLQFCTAPLFYGGISGISAAEPSDHVRVKLNSYVYSLISLEESRFSAVKNQPATTHIILALFDFYSLICQRLLVNRQHTMKRTQMQ